MQYTAEQKHTADFMELDKAIAAIKEDSKGGLVLFAGAGISVAAPSTCPTWNEFLELTLDSARNVYPGLDTYYDAIGGRLKTIKPELLCQILYGNLLDDFWGFLDILQIGQPNFNHARIAQMTLEFSIPLILTTNLDTYIENALNHKGAHFGLHVCSCPQSLLRSLKSQTTKNNLQVVKIHGSLDERTSITLTLRQAGLKLRDDLSQLITTSLTSYPVLVVGYSGNDDDIFPIFLNNASKAKKVYWILWDNEGSLTQSIRVFARECPNCTLVKADRKDVLERLVDNTGITPPNKISEQRGIQTEFLLRWASTTKEWCWKNFFFELLFLLECVNEEVAKIIVKDTETIIRTVTEPWAVTRALVNHAQALILLKEYPSALEALSRAADNYMSWGHHREVIECLTTMITNIPLESEWRGGTPLYWAAHFSGKSFDPYDLGLYNYAAGKYYFRQQRLDLAEEHFFVAGGYARKCGDQITLLHSLDEMGILFKMVGDKQSGEDCIREVDRIKQMLGVDYSDSMLAEGKITKKFEIAAKRNMRRLITGEAVLVFIIALVLGGIACFFLPTFWSKVFTFLAILISGAGVKVWNAQKRFIRYSLIDRS
jgi:hypothetical protein